MLTDKQIYNLEKTLLSMKEQILKINLTNDHNDRENNFNRDELSNYDNHPGDSATALYDQTKEYALNGKRDAELELIDLALTAIKNNNYGICKVCGDDIPYERLETIPYTLHCINHVESKSSLNVQAAEQEVIISSDDNRYIRYGEQNLDDYVDSFQIVARYGTSETPSDLVGDFDSYNELYEDDNDL